MATDHGSLRSAQTGGTGYKIGERPSGPPGEDVKGARTPQVVGEAKEGGANGAELHSQTAAQSTVLKYCKLQHCAA